LARKIPQLHKGLLEPERVVVMARGLRVPKLKQEKVSLLLHKDPIQKTFRRYQAANSIRQVLRRMTDIFRVWCFKSAKSLAFRHGTIYEQLPEVAVVGRVNAGKSQLLQHLFSSGHMRRQSLASTAQWPGKTQGINVYCVNRRFTIADTPGYGQAGIGHPSAERIHRDWQDKWKPLFEEYLNTTHWLRAVIYVHDIGKDVTQADLDTVNMLRDRQIPVLLVLTKDDKVDSDTHRMSRVKDIRTGLKWARHLPHAHYTTRRGGYGQIFKNMLGTMLLGLLATEERADAWEVLRNDLVDIYFDYRDKYVPRPRGFFGKIPKERRYRTYQEEDKPYTDQDLEREEAAFSRQERRRVREEQKAAGHQRTKYDNIKEKSGEFLTPRERRKRWSELLEAAA